MKLKLLAVGFFACLSLCAFAIEDLNIAVDTANTNVVLSWPSDTSESYIVQYRHSLDVTDSWTTLADFYPPDYSGTNITFFYDTNIDWGYSTGSGSMMMMSRSSSSSVFIERETYLNDLIALLIPPGPAVNSGSRTLIRNDSPSPNGTPNGTSSNQNIAGTGFYRVVRDGVHLSGISNDIVLTGVVKIPIEIGNDGGQLTSMYLNSDDSPFSPSIQSPVQNPQILTFDTTQLANGTHNISASVRLEDTNGSLWELDSTTFSVTTSNELTFENWMPNFGELGNSLLVRATSTHTNIDWSVDIYDDSNSYIVSLAGHSDDGDIYVVWDLTDISGVAHTNDNFFTCKVSTPYADPPIPTYKVTDPWLGKGKFAMGVQHAFEFLTDKETLYDELDGFYGAAASVFGVVPGSSGGPYAIHFQDTFETANWAAFKAAIFEPHTRNLIYFGHGSPNGLGYNQGNTNISVTIPEITRLLHTIPAGQTNIHRFRFVFLDGCSTAAGHLPEAFGIIPRENVPLIDYLNGSLRPSAFCGWTKEKVVGILAGGALNFDHVNFIQFIQTDMLLNGEPIHAAYDYARRQSGTSGVFTSEFKIFGCWDLSFGAYNE